MALDNCVDDYDIETLFEMSGKFNQVLSNNGELTYYYSDIGGAVKPYRLYIAIKINVDMLPMHPDLWFIC